MIINFMHTNFIFFVHDIVLDDSLYVLPLIKTILLSL